MFGYACPLRLNQSSLATGLGICGRVQQAIQNKYRLLGDDKTSFAGNRLVISHTVEVSTIGLASDTKDVSH